MSSYDWCPQGAVRRMTFVMGDPDVARDHCAFHLPTCKPPASNTSLVGELNLSLLPIKETLNIYLAYKSITFIDIGYHLNKNKNKHYPACILKMLSE